MSMMMRYCPVCEEPWLTISQRPPITLYSQEFIEGDYQHVVACPDCGMVYASASPAVNYDLDSKYAVPEASGSGENEMERRRLWETVRILENLTDEGNATTRYVKRALLSKDSTILDIGCTRGGMLEALTLAGYTNVMGLDPSAACVEVCHKKGLRAVQGTLSDPLQWKFDLVIMSHVLEHVWDVPGALKKVHQLLKPDGKFYIEVPDASRYLEFLTIPFLDLNREHVNHFSAPLLGDALHRAGLERGIQLGGTRNIQFATGAYPALFAIGGKGPTRPSTVLVGDHGLKDSLKKYVEQSENMMTQLNRQLALQLVPGDEVAVWGYGEFAQQLLRTNAMKAVKIVQVVDNNPRKVGLKMNGVVVEYPQMLRPEIPVVIASIVNRESIYKNARQLGIENRMVVLQ
jgi:SAM-dependent methyltransferase